MAHHSMGYINTTQRDTKPYIATQGIHQWNKSLKEEIHLLKHKGYIIWKYTLPLFNSAKRLIESLEQPSEYRTTKIVIKTLNLQRQSQTWLLGTTNTIKYFSA